MDPATLQVRPDAKGRINLGKLAQGVSSFHIQQMEDGNILLEPYAEVPAREKWLFENVEALKSVKSGLAQASEGKTQSLGSFAGHTDDEID